MAGRPASAQSGQSPLLYWVIAFAILMMASLGLFIFQLTQNQSILNRALDAETRMERYGRPPSYYDQEADARGTNVFAAMENDLRRVATAVTGDAEDVGMAIVRKVDTAIQEVAQNKSHLVSTGLTLLSAFRELNDAHSAELNRANRAEAKIGELQAENESVTAQLAASRQQFEEEAAALRAKLEQAQAEKLDSLDAKDEQLSSAQDKISSLEEQIIRMERERIALEREKDVEISRLQNQVEMLQDQVRVLRPSTFDPTDILTKADGQILRAVPGSEVVYINLGATDDVKVGMRFEVYSQTREVPEGLRGKASLEVVTAMEQTAECRVTRREPDQPIIEGDVIVNIAYERQRKPRFVVRGEFDLNYDGVPDLDGAVRVANLIDQWGGQVVNELDERVDFVVIGLAPDVPELDADRPVSEIVAHQAEMKALMLERFRDLVENASKMYIPVITQNQFLYLTGYVQR